MPPDPHEDLRYPIGRFAPPATVTGDHVRGWIERIRTLPARMRARVASLADDDLERTYRPGGWTVRQVVNHVADSHMNSLVRFKWALTEERPTIKAYDEVRWAELPDYRVVPLATTLDFLDALHARWVTLLEGLGPAELAREFVHPAGGPVALGENVGIYAWHGDHHLAHVDTALRG